jgi:hypothetical protein
MAINSLWTIGTEAKGISPLVLKIATDRDPKNNGREHALLALPLIGADPGLAVPVLRDVLQKENRAQYARFLSARALGL